MKIYLAGPSVMVDDVVHLGEAILSTIPGAQFTELWWDTVVRERQIQRDPDELEHVLESCAQADFSAIQDCDVVIALLVEGVPTLNTYWEIGYAIGLGRPVYTVEVTTTGSALPLQDSCLFLNLCTMRFSIQAGEFANPDALRELITDICGAHTKITERHLEWCRDALFLLVGHDQDHCREENGIGFNRLDTQIGHKLAAELRDVGTLTLPQWGVLMAILPKYRGQPGFPPVPSDLPVVRRGDVLQFDGGCET